MKDTYFVSSQDGSYAAWPLFSPAIPMYGQWAWVHIEGGEVRFIRQMTGDEVERICHSSMVWGVKVSNQPWALVRGRRGSMGNHSMSPPVNPKHTVGV